MIIGTYCAGKPTDPTPVLWDACLACAAGAEHHCTIPYALLAAIKDDAERGHDLISASQLTGCLRQAYLRHTSEYFDFPSSRIPLLVGTAIHGLLSQFIAPGSSAEVDLRYTTEDGIVVTGHTDLVANGNVSKITDWKTTKRIMLSKLPYGEHGAQVNLYRHMLAHNELDPRMEVENLEIVYIDLTGPDTKGGTHNGVVAHPIEVWEEARVAYYIRTRAKMLHLALTEGKLPPRIEVDKRWMCNGYCSMIEQCEEAR